MRIVSLLLLVAMAELPDPGRASSGPAAPAPLVIHCTPTSVELVYPEQAPGQAPKPGQAQPQKRPPVIKNPIAEALNQAKPGTTIFLDPGDYPPFTIGFQSHSPANTTTKGGQPGMPIVVEGKGPGVRILGAEGDTIAIDQRLPNGWITFRNLTIVPGKRAGVMFYERKDGKLHQGYSFEDCHIVGAYDPDTGKGKRSKWGVWGQLLSDFRFVGVRAPARIENISEEHAFYLQNVQGSITIENVHARDLGRTFCQFTARTGNGPVGLADVIVRDCVVEDACIAQADGFKGGAAFTICGRMPGTFLFENNVYKAGFRAERARFTLPGQPYGTGAFTAWEESRAGQNGTLVLRDNDFAFAPGCGDRPVVSIGGCTRVLIVGENRFSSGGKQPALALDPVNQQGRPVSTPNGSVFLAPVTKTEGELWIQNKPASPEQLALLQKKAPDEPAPGSDPPPEGGG